MEPSKFCGLPVLSVREGNFEDKKQLSGTGSPPSLLETPPRPGIKLRFVNSLPSLIFTSSRIEANDGSPVAIELVDADMNKRITLHPLSSSRLDVVVLDGDFTMKSWTTEEFNRKILQPREGRRPLLAGDLTVTLDKGIGVIGDDVVFTDNSSWLRSRKFRLGAKATEGGVVEAVTEAFVCKDHREVSYRKHHPPYPDSEVWRLDKITKNGVTESRLGQAGIHTVKDLRRHLAINSNALPRTLETKITEKRWKAIVSHSMQCVLDESECYVYNSETDGASLLFNSVYEVIRVSFNGLTVQNATELTYIQKVLVDKLKPEAYRNVDKFVPVDRSLQKALPWARDVRFGIASKSKVTNEGPCATRNMKASSAGTASEAFRGQRKIADERPDSPQSMSASSVAGETFGYERKIAVGPDSPRNVSASSAAGEAFKVTNVGPYSPRNINAPSAAGDLFGCQRKIADVPDSPRNLSASSAAGEAFVSQRKIADGPESPQNMSDSSAPGEIFGYQRNNANDSPRNRNACSSSSKASGGGDEGLDSSSLAFGGQRIISDEAPDSLRIMTASAAASEVFVSQRKFGDKEPQFPRNLRESSDKCEVFVPLNRSLVSSSAREYDLVLRYKKGYINDVFISHLRAALCRRGISVDEDFDEKDDVPECRVLIVFLTSRYVTSNLPDLLEYQRRKNRVVFPIFYGISPFDLLRFIFKDKPQRWWDALNKTVQMYGYTLTDKSETELIDQIVADVLSELCSNDKKNIIGIDMQVEEIMSLLCIESPDVCSIGIWGTVGIGKTTIVEEIHRRISTQYETCVFLKDLHETVELKGHDAVTEKLLTKILDIEPNVLRISEIKSSFLRSKLQRKRVLLILDDVNDFMDVETYLGMLNYFCPGSRIIITSRNRRVFVRSKVNHVYEVKPLDVSTSILLLCRGTLQNVLSQEAYKPLLLELVKFANGNPQVLQFLREEKSKILEEGRDWLSQQVSPIFIPHIYERSCCGLDDNERTIFLDIACFFTRMDKDNIAMLLDGCGFSAHVGFRSLVDKSLLTISHNLVDMHRFIQATGREIVRQESVDSPGERSRLWDPEDIIDIFVYDKGTTAIEGIFLDMSKQKFDANPNLFEKMCNLRLLKFYCSRVENKHGVSLPQGLEHLPSKLRLLHWEYYPLSSLPRSFDPKNLVELNLLSSSVKKLWKGKKSLEKLKRMRLSYSSQLTKIPRLSSAPNLELLDLEGCYSLLSISQSISSLKKLVSLNLKDCLNLESIPSMVDLESLEVLNLSGCSKLENFPEISSNVKELYMGGTMIQEIPSSIKNLVLLEILDLENSRHLVNLPTSICKLKHLETLNLSGCSSLERFPDLSRRMKCLKSLDLSRTAIKELPSSISYLTALEELRFVDCRNLVRLPDNAWSLRFKVEFRQIDTEKFSRLWNRFGWLKKVKIS